MLTEFALSKKSLIYTQEETMLQKLDIENNKKDSSHEQHDTDSEMDISRTTKDPTKTEAVPPGIFAQVGFNAIEMMLKLPKRSFSKKYLINQLSSSTNTVEFANLVGVTPQYVQQCSHIQDSDNELFKKHMKEHKKNKVDLTSIEDAKKWFGENTKIVYQDGKESGTRTTSFSSNELFSSFRICSPTNSIGKKIFVRVQKKLRIHQAKHKLYDLFSCPKCPKKLKLEEQLHICRDPDVIADIETKIKAIEYHQLVAKAQWESFHETCDELDAKSCLILQDFGKQYTQEGKAVVHVMILFYKINNELVWRYLDFFDADKCGQSGFEFVEASWLSLIEMGVLTHFSNVHVWSDGGGADYYNTTYIYFFSSLQRDF
jgi:hypothetical protein